MTSIHLTALVAALAVGAAAPLAAQDTSAAARSPQDTSAYQGAAGVDTSAQPGRTGGKDTMPAGAADTAGLNRAAVDSAAPDTTKPGERSTRKPTKAERRMHPVDSAAANDTSAKTDTTGMPGRHQGDTTNPGSTASPGGDRASGDSTR